MIPVNGKRVKYIKLDPIFYLSEAHPYSSKNIKQPERIVCSVCNKENPKKSQKCEFCSLFTCLECSPKTYPFPLVEADSLKGVICLICEAKLHINAVSAFYYYNLQTISCYENNIRIRESELYRKELEANKIMKLKENVSKQIDHKKLEL